MDEGSKRKAAKDISKEDKVYANLRQTTTVELADP